MLAIGAADRPEIQAPDRNHTLLEMANTIDLSPGWWKFPSETPVQGFMGTGPIFIVGDQPSLSKWEYSNRNRRCFYDLLPRVGAAEAHLTDFYKRRGKSGTLRKRISVNEIPEDFAEHLEFFRAELKLLEPTRIVALGGDACWLLENFVPEVRHLLRTMWHFAYPVRWNKVALYEEKMKMALLSP